MKTSGWIVAVVVVTAALAGEARAVGLHALDHTRFWGVGGTKYMGALAPYHVFAELRGGATKANPDSDFGAQVGFDYRLRLGWNFLHARTKNLEGFPVVGSAGGAFAWRVWTWNVPSDGALLLRSAVETAYDDQGFQPLFAAGVGARLTTKWFNAIRLEIGYEFWPWAHELRASIRDRVEHRARVDVAIGPAGISAEVKRIAAWGLFSQEAETFATGLLVWRY